MTRCFSSFNERWSKKGRYTKLNITLLILDSILESTQKLDPFAAKFENRRQILPIFAEGCQTGTKMRSSSKIVG